MRKINILGSLIICFILILITIVPSTAVENVNSIQLTNRTIYVDDDGGADYTNIQDAIDAASDGDTIFIYDGTYIENIVIDKSINLIGEDKHTVIIDGDELDTVITITHEYVDIREVTITKSEWDWSTSGIYLEEYAHHIHISDTILTDNNYAILAPSNNTMNLVITNTTISSNRFGIYSSSSPTTQPAPTTTPASKTPQAATPSRPRPANSRA